MSKGKFGEPLQVIRGELERGFKTFSVASRIGYLAVPTLSEINERPRGLFERMVDCTNALDGVEDPAGFVVTASYNKIAVVEGAKAAIEVEAERDELRRKFEQTEAVLLKADSRIVTLENERDELREIVRYLIATVENAMPFMEAEDPDECSEVREEHSRRADRMEYRRRIRALLPGETPSEGGA